MKGKTGHEIRNRRQVDIGCEERAYMEVRLLSLLMPSGIEPVKSLEPRSLQQWERKVADIKKTDKQRERGRLERYHEIRLN